MQKTIQQYQDAKHKIFTSESVLATSGKVFNIYKDHISTYKGLKKTTGGQKFVIINCQLLVKSTKKQVIKFLESN
jgi:hypothetical protein